MRDILLRTYPLPASAHTVRTLLASPLVSQVEAALSKLQGMKKSSHAAAGAASGAAAGADIVIKPSKIVVARDGEMVQVAVGAWLSAAADMV